MKSDCPFCDIDSAKMTEPIPIYDYQDKQVKMFLLPRILQKEIEKTIYKVKNYDEERYIISVSRDENGKYDVKLIKKKSLFRKIIDFLLRRT